METITRLRLGPDDHGKELSFDEYVSGDYQEGHQYELIAGKLHVSPLPNYPQGIWEQWLLKKLMLYSHFHPEVVNLVTGKCRVFVPDRVDVTTPEPDVAAYRAAPLHLPASEVDWRDVSPMVVAEVVSPSDPDKDLVRNVELYLQVPSIREYWILDNRDEADQPRLLVYRRRGNKWQRVIDVVHGETYTTKLLPDFELVLDRNR